MKKVSITIKNKQLIFKYRVKKLDEPNLLNTNVISNNELVFSDEYINENTKIVNLFITDLAKENDISEVVVSTMSLGLLIFNIINKIPVIRKFTILDDSTLSYDMCELIVKSKNIKLLDCYAIPQFMIEKLDKYGIDVESRNEVLFTSNFMASNDLNSFSKMYYKKSIRLSEVLGVDDITDFEVFCDINKYLRVIHFDTYSLSNIKAVVKVLKKKRIKNVLLEVHDDISVADDILELRNINKDLKKSKIKINLVYSKDYLERNYIKQIILTTLKICALIIFGITLSVCGYVLYNNVESENKVNKIKGELKDIMEDESPDEPEIIEPGNGDNSNNNNSDNQMINSYDKLYGINKDMAGWITIKGTKIDYPIVRAKNNRFYLDKNIYKEKDYNGWVFMDYRNNIETLDDNTIIYAHNRYTSGVMFGTLPGLRKKAWYSNEENYDMTFNTLYENHTWRIFSYYGIDVTSDYLVTNFLNDKDKLDFINMITNRSERKFKTKVGVDDKIVTLSTCLDNNKRFVVHAVLIK